MELFSILSFIIGFCSDDRTSCALVCCAWFQALQAPQPLVVSDTLIEIVRFCDCGSDWKSWTLTCKSWNSTTKVAFPNPKDRFGNKLINILDEVDGVDIINQFDEFKNIANRNPYLPQWWKDENILPLSDISNAVVESSYPFHYLTLDEMDWHVSDFDSEPFSSEMLFYRPFDNDKEFFDFFDELRIVYKYRFLKKDLFYFHHSISVKAIESIETRCINIRIDWDIIPITHHGYLSDDDWDILMRHGVYNSDSSSDHNYLMIQSIQWARYWAKYPTTTPEMIRSIKDNIEDSISELFVVCPNSTHQEIVDVINEPIDIYYKMKVWRALLYNRFGTQFPELTTGSSK